MPKLFKERGVERRPMGTNENKHKDKQKKAKKKNVFKYKVGSELEVYRN